MKYQVAECVFEIHDLDGSTAWRDLSSNYLPFKIESSDDAPMFDIEILVGTHEHDNDGLTVLHKDDNLSKTDVSLYVYRDDKSAEYWFYIIQPGDQSPMAWLKASKSLDNFTAIVDERNAEIWKLHASLTSALQLAYMLATNDKHVLMTHSSCIVCYGRAYLFLGKSGTGKSTHSRLWLKHIDGARLLNDDHPIIRIKNDKEVIAYGSPWSGKTNCYINDQAPIGAIVRIKQAPFNSIKQLSVIESYASLTTSMFRMPFDAKLSDNRHIDIESVIERVPCYQLSCLPDREAALICHGAVCG